MEVTWLGVNSRLTTLTASPGPSVATTARPPVQWYTSLADASAEPPDSGNMRGCRALSAMAVTVGWSNKKGGAPEASIPMRTVGRSVWTAVRRSGALGPAWQ